MPVIKQQHAAPLLKEAIVLDLGDVGRQAARIVAAAQEKAGKLISDAQAQAATLTQGAEQKGHEQGYAQGLAQGRKEGFEQGQAQGHQQAHQEAGSRLTKLQQSWTQALQSWQDQQQQLLKDAREATLELSLRLTERIVHRVVEADPTVVIDQVGACLAHVMEASQVVIHIHPQDQALLEESLPELAAEFEAATHARIATDEHISPGGCVVAYGKGRIDATLETQLARAVDLILPQDESTSSMTVADELSSEAVDDSENDLHSTDDAS